MLPGGPCFITSQTLPFALTVFGGDSVVGYPFIRRDNQKWVAIWEGDDLWSLVHLDSGKFLSTAGEPGPGAKVIIADSPTLWQVKPGPEDPNSFSIFIPGSPLNVSLDDSAGAPVILQDDPIQAWVFMATTF